MLAQKHLLYLVSFLCSVLVFVVAVFVVVVLKQRALLYRPDCLEPIATLLSLAKCSDYMQKPPCYTTLDDLYENLEIQTLHSPMIQPITEFPVNVTTDSAANDIHYPHMHYFLLQTCNRLNVWPLRHRSWLQR